MLPDEYLQTLDLALKEGKISKDSFTLLKTVSTRFLDMKYTIFNKEGDLIDMCLNENGVHLMMERTLKHPEKANVIGITGADELGGQIRIKDGKSYNFSLDINNLTGVNKYFGSIVGDAFIQNHIDAYRVVVDMAHEGKITDPTEMIEAYFAKINLATISVPLSKLSPKQLLNLKENGAAVNGQNVDVKIGNLVRIYSKDSSIVHKGASATVVLAEINVNERRGVSRVEEFLRDEVKNVKKDNTKFAGLVIEERDYKTLTDATILYDSKLIKVKGGKKEVETKTVNKISKKNSLPTLNKKERNKLSREAYQAIKEKYGAAVESSVKGAVERITPEQLTMIDAALSENLSKAKANDLALDLKIPSRNAQQIIDAAKTSLNKTTAGSLLTLVISVVGMQKASELVSKYCPDIDPTTQFAACVTLGHLVNQTGFGLVAAIKTGTSLR